MKILTSALALALIANGGTPAFSETSDTSVSVNDAQDQEFSRRGFIRGPLQNVIRNEGGDIVRDLRGLDLYDGEVPSTVDPRLWREARLLKQTGLFRVTDQIYQIRGFDHANMSIIVGETGLIVVDPLMAVEAARAGMELARTELGDLPVVAVIYTHSHTDHTGGIEGILDNALEDLPIYAPANFIQGMIDENVLTGNAMSRRAAYQFGFPLEWGPKGMIGTGNGPGFPSGIRSGTITLRAPTHEITGDVEAVIIDGITFEFMNTPEAEASQEMVFYLPQMRALCGSEVAIGTIHNIVPPRGAAVRDVRKWVEALTEMDERFGPRSDVYFASHMWPRFGSHAIRDYLQNHRDAYKYLHDQTVRLINLGYTPTEISSKIELPQSLSQYSYNRGFYGAIKAGARAIYQRYMGWYSGDPVDLNPLPTAELAQRYVAALGGQDRVIALGEQATNDGDLQWAAELLHHAVFAEPQSQRARAALANVFEQLGYEAESATWRNSYLTGALELREGVPPPRFNAMGSSLAVMPFDTMFDLLAVRLDPALSRGRTWSIGVTDIESGERAILRIKNDVLTHEISAVGVASIEVAGARSDLLKLFGTQNWNLIETNSIALSGNRVELQSFLAVFPSPPSNYAIVTPN